MLSLIFSPLCVEKFAILKKIPGFARCHASNLLGVCAGSAHPLIRRLGCMHEVVIIAANLLKALTISLRCHPVLSIQKK
jgi:hypothetical protein